MDRRGEERGRSSPFQFSEPRPMDELVTLEGDEDGNMDMLLVVPKATLLQVGMRDTGSSSPGPSAFIPREGVEPRASPSLPKLASPPAIPLPGSTRREG